MLQCVAVCCGVLQCVAVCCSVCVAVWCETSALVTHLACNVLLCVFVVLQCVAVRCSVLQCVAVCCSVLRCVAEYCSVCVAVCCIALQCVALCCSVLQCVAVRRSVLQCFCDAISFNASDTTWSRILGLVSLGFRVEFNFGFRFQISLLARYSLVRFLDLLRNFL